MTRLIAPILIGAATGSADLTARAIEDQHVGVATAVSIAIFAGGAMLWLSRQFEKRDEALGKANEALQIRLAKIEQKIDDLPCGNKRHCPEGEI